MYGRQGDPIYTQADWSGIGDKIAQALGFAGTPPQSQQPSPFRFQAPQPHAQPAGRPVPFIPQALQQAAPLPPSRPAANFTPSPMSAVPAAPLPPSRPVQAPVAPAPTDPNATALQAAASIPVNLPSPKPADNSAALANAASMPVNLPPAAPNFFDQFDAYLGRIAASPFAQATATGATVGGLNAAGTGQDPVTGAILGAGAGAAGSTLARGVGALAQAATPSAAVAPSTQALKDTAQAAHGGAFAPGHVIDPAALQRLLDSIRTTMAANAFDPALHPGGMAVVNRIAAFPQPGAPVIRLTLTWHSDFALVRCWFARMRAR